MGTVVRDSFYTRLFALFLASNVWTLLMTTIPVVATVNPTNYYKYNDWYSGNDVMRFVEPVGGFLFNLYIFQLSGIFSRVDQALSNDLVFSLDHCLFFIFFFGAAIYGQGAGFHSGSNMIKHAVESISAVHNDDVVKDVMYWIRTVWEHEVSHYLYAAGYAFMAAAQVWAFKDHNASANRSTNSAHAAIVSVENVPSSALGQPAALASSDGDVEISPHNSLEHEAKSLTNANIDSTEAPQCLSLLNQILLVSAAAVYGLLIATVAIDFPSGLAVAIVYLVGYGGGCVGTYLYWYRRKYNLNSSFWSLHDLPVVRYFVASYSIGLALVILWIIVAGGFHTRSEAGVGR